MIAIVFIVFIATIISNVNVAKTQRDLKTVCGTTTDALVPMIFRNDAQEFDQYGR